LNRNLELEDIYKDSEDKKKIFRKLKVIKKTVQYLELYGNNILSDQNVLNWDNLYKRGKLIKMKINGKNK